MKKNSFLSFLAIVFILSSCNKNNDDIIDENDKYYSKGHIIIKGSTLHNNRVEHFVEYPNCIKLNEQAVIRVRAELKCSNTEKLVIYDFYNPSNGTITKKEIISDDADILCWEYIFEPGSTGEAIIYTNMRQPFSDHIIITVE